MYNELYFAIKYFPNIELNKVLNVIIFKWIIQIPSLFNFFTKKTLDLFIKLPITLIERIFHVHVDVQYPHCALDPYLAYQPYCWFNCETCP